MRQVNLPDAARLALDPAGPWLLAADPQGGFVVMEAVGEEGVADYRFAEKQRVTAAGQPVPGTFGALAISPDGRHVATHAGVWRRSEPPVQVARWITPMSAVSFSPDGRWLASATPDGQVQLRARVAGGVDATWLPHDGRVQGLALSADGRWLATGADDRLLRVFDTRTWQEAGRIGHEDAVSHVVFSDDGRWIASVAATSARVFDAMAPRSQRLRFSSTDVVSGAAFSADGRWFVAATADGAGGTGEAAVQVFDTATWAAASPAVRTTGRIETVAFSGDGRWLATRTRPRCSHGVLLAPAVVRVWDRAGAREVAWGTDLEAGTSNPSCRNPAGVRAEVQGGGDIARVREAAGWRWRALDHQPALPLRGPDGRWEVHGAGDWDNHALSVRPLRPMELMQLACGRLPRGFDAQEWKQYMGHEKDPRPTCPIDAQTTPPEQAAASRP